MKNYGTDQQRLQISELHFDKFLTPHTFSCWKIRFKTEVRFCSNFPEEAKRWIKDLTMVNSVDDLKSPCSIQRINPFPDFELLDERIADCLGPEQDYPEFLFQERGQSGETKGSET